MFFFSNSDIFDAMSLVKHGAGETVIQQGLSHQNALISSPSDCFSTNI